MNLEKLRGQLIQINEAAIGRSGDDLEFRISTASPGDVEVYFRDDGPWVARVPGLIASVVVLEAIASAVRIGTALGRAQGKREIGAFLRNECGL